MHNGGGVSSMCCGGHGGHGLESSTRLSYVVRVHDCEHVLKHVLTIQNCNHVIKPRDEDSELRACD